MFLFSSLRRGERRVRMPLAVGVTAVVLFVGRAQAQHDHAMPVAPLLPSASATVTSAPPVATSVPILLQFESILSRYKPMTDQKLGSWREANDTVTRIGGWRAYLKESQTPEVAAPASPATSAKPAQPVTPVTPNPHAGHGAKP